MEREYELFEQLADGSPMWRDHVSGLREARRKLEELSKTTANKCFAMYLPTKEIVARLNVGGSRGAIGEPVVFQIAYDDRLAMAGDKAKARTAYQDFLTLWKDADPNIPLLKQAKAEYAKLL